jgi:hypothetical protein
LYFLIKVLGLPPLTPRNDWNTMNRNKVIEYIKSLSEQEVQDLLIEVQDGRVSALQDKITDLAERMAQIIDPQKFEATVDLTVNISGSLLVDDSSEKPVGDSLEVNITCREGSQATISDSLLEHMGQALTDQLYNDIELEEDTEILELETLYSQVTEVVSELREEIEALDEVDEDLLNQTNLSGDIYSNLWDRITQHAIEHHSSASIHGIAASPRR